MSYLQTKHSNNEFFKQNELYLLMKMFVIELMSQQKFNHLTTPVITSIENGDSAWGK